MGAEPDFMRLTVLHGSAQHKPALSVPWLIARGVGAGGILHVIVPGGLCLSHLGPPKGVATISQVFQRNSNADHEREEYGEKHAGKCIEDEIDEMHNKENNDVFSVSFGELDGDFDDVENF